MDTEDAGIMPSEDVEKLLELARAQDKQEHFQEMLEIAQQICELDPSSAEAFALKARALQKLKANVPDPAARSFNERYQRSGEIIESEHRVAGAWARAYTPG